jgi:hypothetical protein
LLVGTCSLRWRTVDVTFFIPFFHSSCNI